MPCRCSRALRFQCSQRTETACRQPLRFPDGSSPTSCLPSKHIARASPIRSAFLRRRSPRRVNQATWPARATAPEQSFELQPSQLRLQARNVSATPSDEIAAALASTMARRSLEVVTAVGSAPVFASLKQSRVSVRRPLAKLSIATARAQRSFGLKPAQLQLS